MFFAVTIDTEEDNWGEYDRAAFTVENVRRIPLLQQIFEEHGVRPTYLITHPVATSGFAADILGRYRVAGACEIGTHLHPWNTPPAEETRSNFNSFACHLPADLQLRKIRTLHEAIGRRFGAAPTSFRSGRWGFSDEVARNLIRMGYLVDSSISPALDWREFGGPDYSRFSLQPFVYSMNGEAGPNGGALLEVPATVDFVQGISRTARRVYHTVRTRVPLGPKVLGVLDRLRALNLVTVSPEIDDAPSMIRLVSALAARGTAVINMFFHSPSLLENCSPYVRSAQDLGDFLGRIRRVLAYARSAGLTSVTLSELAVVPREQLGAHSVKMLSATTV